MEFQRINQLLKKHYTPPHIALCDKMDISVYNGLRNDILYKLDNIRMDATTSKQIMSARRYADLLAHGNDKIKQLCLLCMVLFDLEHQLNKSITYETVIDHEYDISEQYTNALFGIIPPAPKHNGHQSQRAPTVVIVD